PTARLRGVRSPVRSDFTPLDSAFGPLPPGSVLARFGRSHLPRRQSKRALDAARAGETRLRAGQCTRTIAELTLPQPVRGSRLRAGCAPVAVECPARTTRADRAHRRWHSPRASARLRRLARRSSAAS